MRKNVLLWAVVLVSGFGFSQDLLGQDFSRIELSTPSYQFKIAPYKEFNLSSGAITIRSYMINRDATLSRDSSTLRGEFVVFSNVATEIRNMEDHLFTMLEGAEIELNSFAKPISVE